MKLPAVESPQRFRGLYVFDFGEWTAVGYTADEIAILLESEEYRAGQVYRIERAQPDGSMELRGISRERFRVESGLLFYRQTLDAARADFTALLAGAEQTPPPCRCFIQLFELPGAAPSGACGTALIYPAEFDDEVARWLAVLHYTGGDTVEGGASHVSNYYSQAKTIVQREQLWSPGATASRSAAEVLASVRRAVQR